MVLTANHTIVEPLTDTVPEEMRQLNNWVVWKTKKTKEVNDDGEQILSKVLKQKNGRSAKSNDSKTWTDFHTAYQSYISGNFDGIGFVFQKENKIIGIDLDGHFDDELPLTEFAEFLCKKTFVEISPSGTGAHAYFIGDMPKDFKNKYKDDEGEIEIYNDGRYFTFTGQNVGTDSISNNQKIIDKIVDVYFKKEASEIEILPAKDVPVYPSSEIKKKMFRYEKVKQLFDGDLSEHDNDQSSADMALANHLAFWTGKNAEQMDGIFRESQLYRDKWDKVHYGTGETYGEYTINKAIKECRNVYRQSVTNPQESKEYTWDDVVTFESDEVLPFPRDIFPTWLESHIDQVAMATQTPREMAAMGAFSALSIALSKKFDINVYGDWHEPLNTYLLTLMPPSSKKSQVFKDMMSPIRDYQTERRDFMKQSVAENTHDKDVKEGRITKLKRSLSDPKKGDKIAELEEDLKYAIEDYENHEEIHSPTYIADDTTTEVLAQLMDQNDEKLGIISAEGGLFNSIKGKYSDVSNYEIYLAGFSGDRMSTHRLHRSAIELEEPLLSIGVFAQPSVIQSLPKEFFDRGLMARFLYSLPQDNRGDRAIRPKPKDPQITKTYYDNIKALLNTKTEGVHLKLSHLADLNVQLLQEEIEHRQGPDGDLQENDDIGAWSGKLVGQLMRLAGLIHMSHVLTYSNYEVQNETIHSIEKLKEYYISHMKKAFNVSGEDKEMNNLRYLVERIIEKNEEGSIKRQKLWQLVKRKFPKSNEFDNLLGELEERSYIKVKDISEGRGRPSKTIILNPTIL